MHLVIVSTSVNYISARSFVKLFSRLINNTVVNWDYVFSKEEVINV